MYIYVVSCTQTWVGYVLTLELHQLINQVLHLFTFEYCYPNFCSVCEAGEVEEMEDTTVLAELG